MSFFFCYRQKHLLLILLYFPRPPPLGVNIGGLPPFRNPDPPQRYELQCTETPPFLALLFVPPAAILAARVFRVGVQPPQNPSLLLCVPDANDRPLSSA